MRIPLCFAVLFLMAGLSSVRAHADAVVVTRAMTASTIAEIFIEDDRVRVELEIGGERDLRVFRRILPEDAYTRFGGNEPNAERHAAFFREDFVIRAGVGDALPGRVIETIERTRVTRDEITGEPLPVRSGTAERVYFAVLEYSLTERPRVLHIRPPMDAGEAAAEIGFVAYHRGLAVNDFQYLAREESLSLDWEDPWFSGFRNPQLQRHFSAPVSVFVYVEPFEVRKEIVIRPKDLQQWTDLGLDASGAIPAGAQETIKQRAAAFLAARGPVTIDGAAVEPVLDRVNFLRLSLRMTGVIETPEDLDADSATLGIIFAYPTEGLPQSVTMRWDLFGGRARNVFASVTDEAGSQPALLTPENPVLRWENRLVNPRGMSMRTVQPPPEPERFALWWTGVLAGAGIALGLVVWRRNRTAALAAVLLGAAAGLLVPNPWARRPTVEASEAELLVGDLLYNIYRAFDRRDEGLVYDRLSQSVGGELLTEVYLQTRRSMEVENQGGARVKVEEVYVQEASVETALPDGGFTADCRWHVSGSVGHWGHTHVRLNEYTARFTVRPMDGAWKLAAIELRGEVRLDPATGLPLSEGAP